MAAKCVDVRVSVATTVLGSLATLSQSYGRLVVDRHLHCWRSNRYKYNHGSGLKIKANPAKQPGLALVGPKQAEQVISVPHMSGEKPR
jgi:hypothetical protein